MKRIVFSLGFAAKEHIAIAEKLLSEPPKERFDRVIVDKQVLNRDKHLRNLRLLIKKVRAMDMNVDKKYLSFCKITAKSRRESLHKEFQKLDKKLQATFVKFFYKQKVIEEMIVVAGNVHEKFQASLRRIHEIEALHKSAARTAEIEAERSKIATLELFGRRPRATGQDTHGGSKPAPRGFCREEIHQPWSVVPRSDSGRQHWFDERRREI
jgi:hypothetical protein